MRRLGFTMLELIFVIVIMGIIGKFGVSFLAQAYKSFIFSSVNHSLQSNAQMAVESIATRLQYRIKDSIIKRQSATFANFEAISTTVAAGTESDYNILEWVSTDIDGYRGTITPNWSGIIDLSASGALSLNSPATNTASINSLISTLSDANSTINDSALYFLGSESDINSSYGWTGNAITTQDAAMHPVQAGGISNFVPTNGATGAVNSFAGVDIYEYYKLAWTAYAIGIDDYNIGVNAGTNTGTLRLWYNYQPWQGEQYNVNGTSTIIMENVSTFQFKSIGSIIKIQVCVKSLLVNNGEGDYSVCKEKTIF